MEDIYLPLSRLLNLQVRAARRLAMVQDAFLGHQAAPPPYIIGIAGSVAVGKSTLARVLRAILARWPDHPRVELVTTDGFLHPTRVLQERGLMRRKGFPESYDLRRMLGFLNALKAGEPEVAAPVYSHLKYDIIPGEEQVLRAPRHRHLRGAERAAARRRRRHRRLRLLRLLGLSRCRRRRISRPGTSSASCCCRRSPSPNPDSYFHHFRDLPLAEARAVAAGIWREINLANLRENIQPTRRRARLVLRKGDGHRIEQVWLRRM